MARSLSAITTSSSTFDSISLKWRIWHISSLVLLGIIAVILTGAAQQAHAASLSGDTVPSHLQQATFTVDGVTVNLRTPFLPAQTFITTKPGDATQMATASSPNPFREFT